jgi:AAA domain
MKDQIPSSPATAQDSYRAVIRQKIVDSIARPVPKLTQRDIWLPAVSKKAIAVIGMRRAGKTSLLWQIMAQQLEVGVPREALVYFSFEDERLAGLKAVDLQLVLEEYFKLYPKRRDRAKTVFLLDEIQLVPGWEGFVRRILDTETIELYLSKSQPACEGGRWRPSSHRLALEKCCAIMALCPKSCHSAGRKRSAPSCIINWCNISRKAASRRCKACLNQPMRASDLSCSKAT